MKQRNPSRAILVWLATATLSGPNLFGQVRRVQVPEGGICPDVSIGHTGSVYLVFGKNGNAYFAQSLDGGKSFSKPRRLNWKAGSILTGHERGPKVVIGRGEILHVIWMDTRAERLEYTRKTLAGTNFDPPRNLLDAGTHLDGATVSADNSGNVEVAWLDARLPADLANPLSLPIFVTVSHNDGGTFSPNARLKANFPIHACSCCALKSLAEAKGIFEVAFRGAYQSVRDPYIVRVAAANNGADAVVGKIQDLRWRFDACPMAGPSLARGRDPNEIWAAWMSDSQAYYARSGDSGRSFSRALTPRSEKTSPRNHPLILVNPKGEVFLSWEEGGNVLWQISDGAGNFRSSGNAGILPDKSKATGFVDRDGSFCLVF